LRVADAKPEATTVAALGERLDALGLESVPLLVVRLPALERTAWRDGLRAARALERRANAAFATAVARVLRAEDLIAHDRGTDAFVAALVAPMRDGHRAFAPVDIRSALARIATTVEGLMRLDVDSGWTRHDGGAASIDRAIGRALVRGAQERERYAFFSAVGHELRTPLSSIRGYLETLLTDDVDAATRRRFVRIAYNESLRLSRLLEGMFEISLLDLSATFPLHAAGSLEIALAGVADACASVAQARAVRLQIAAIEPTPVAIDGDRLMLVLINLVDNAIKHGRPGGTVRVWCELSHPRVVSVAVDDDGPGIASAERERIFALGERGSSGSDGSGIGLALVRMLLERIGGRVEVTDAPCGGARFTITVPRRTS
jgi:signal transduction histidine kinase